VVVVGVVSSVPHPVIEHKAAAATQERMNVFIIIFKEGCLISLNIFMLGLTDGHGVYY